MHASLCYPDSPPYMNVRLLYPYILAPLNALGRLISCLRWAAPWCSYAPAGGWAAS